MHLREEKRLGNNIAKGGESRVRRGFRRGWAWDPVRSYNGPVRPAVARFVMIIVVIKMGKKFLIETFNELMDVSIHDFGNLILPEEEIIHWFELLDAAWIHNGDPSAPHAELTSGNCSNAFFDCLRVLKYVNLSNILAKQLHLLMDKAVGPMMGTVKWVIGSPMAAITFAHDFARHADIPISMFVEKDPADKKRMLWNRMNIPFTERVLQIEELITTAHTLNEVERAVRDGNDPESVDFVPFIGTLVYRPSKMTRRYGDRTVFALIEREVWAVSPEECPLCKQGSKRLRPKQNWKELTGKS